VAAAQRVSIGWWARIMDPVPEAVAVMPVDCDAARQGRSRMRPAGSAKNSASTAERKRPRGQRLGSLSDASVSRLARVARPDGLGERLHQLDRERAS